MCDAFRVSFNCRFIHKLPKKRSDTQFLRSSCQSMPNARKKEAISIVTKQKAIRLLGAHSDGSFGITLINESTGKFHTQPSVSKLLTVPPASYLSVEGKVQRNRRNSHSCSQEKKSWENSEFELIETSL